MQNIIEHIELLDAKAVLFLNQLHNPSLDKAIYFATQGWFWMPVYLYFIYLVFSSFNESKNRITTLCAFAILIFMTDQSSVQLFKEVFQRYRPCHHLELHSSLHLVYNKCGGMYSFVSSHATNFMGLAVFTSVFFRLKSYLVFGLVFWAIFMGFTRVYLAVHYPTDVFFGWMLGAIIGYTVAVNMRYYFVDPEKNQ